MRISLNWLKDFLDLDKSPEQIADILTSLGLEVEGMETQEQVAGGLKSVVVGEVLEVWQHPNADRLRLTRVHVGNETILQIVCGAPNVAAGQKVLVALEGAELHPTAGEPIKIKKGKIRGEESMGMICAEDELGIGQSHDGILILDTTAVPGTQAADYLNLESDTIFEIGLTPNRADATNHLGVARDLLAWIRVHENPAAQLKSVEDSKDSNKLHETHIIHLDVQIERPDLCPRYSGVCLQNLKIGPSPEWLQKRILAMDLKPINNVVDITNFVMFDMGQPLHAFDLHKIGKGIKVKTLPSGTPFQTLDGVDRKLRSEDLMICDVDSKPLCIAGVLGGAESGISESTTSLFLESAHFNASSIRKTSTAHLIRSQAARCFEKGSDPNITLQALHRAVTMMQEYCGAEVTSEWLDHYPEPVLPVQVSLSLEQVKSLSGLDLNDDNLKRVLFALDMELMDLRDGNYQISVPTNKPDVTRRADVIEEITRVYGFDNIPVPENIRISFPQQVSSLFALKKQLGDWLSARGLTEIMNISLGNSQICLKSGLWKEEELVYINNTSNVSLDIMKPATVLNGLESIQFNQNRQQSDLALFEFAKDYLRQGEKFKEVQKLGIWLTGAEAEAHWSKPKPDQVGFFNVKSLIDGILVSNGMLDLEQNECPAELYYEYQYVWSRQKKQLASAGLVSRALTSLYEIKKPVFYAEIDLAFFQKSMHSQKIRYQEISKFPSSRRDLAVVLEESVPFSSLQEIAFSKAGKNLRELSLFDIYRSEDQLGLGKKSYALSLLFESQDRSLSSQELDLQMDKIIKAYEKELGALIRR
ncbi:MAG: phenylalanine--tRNA ligase subunit beta [Saprospiraceae bacterium]|nr:phenylalanine--tRNA ligase subunit beta [Candidatus Vicinibacter proximus]